MAGTHWVFILAVLVCSVNTAYSKDEPGDSCSIAEDHCGAPKSGLGCCLPATKCYELAKADCASFIKACPFTSDTKKGTGLATCLPDTSSFNRTKCPADVANSQDVVANAQAACYASAKLTCNVFTNSSGAKHITAECKVPPPGKSAASVAATSGAFMVMMATAGLVALMLM